MSIYRTKGCKVWTMDFLFHGQRIRETTGMTSKTRAKEVYEKRKQALKDGTAGIRRQPRPDLLSTAAAEWQQSKQLKWSPKMRDIAKCSLAHLLPVMGKRLLVDIEARDIAKYQASRLTEGASNRTVNIEVGMLRQIMRKYAAWARIQSDVTMLPERQDAGCALTAEQEQILLLECGRSVSRALLPFVTLALETGARYNTIRTLQWGNIDFVNRCLKFGKDKTASGTGRTVPLNQRAIETLKFWAQDFPNRQPSHFVFPSERYGLHGSEGTFGGTVQVYDCDPDKPVGTIQSAWQSAKKRTQRHCPSCGDGILIDREKPETGYECEACHFETPNLPAALTRLRFHDLRHSAVSRMIAARVPIPMIAKIVGWSPSTMAKMAARYGHFGIEELRSAVESISSTAKPEIAAGYPQNPPQSDSERKVNIN
ncbi:MAG: tyrosine-type recombinase/integrase [Acidobacteriaceae bacterium]